MSALWQVNHFFLMSLTVGVHHRLPCADHEHSVDARMKLPLRKPHQLLYHPLLASLFRTQTYTNSATCTCACTHICAYSPVHRSVVQQWQLRGPWHEI
jgi:hypothetical protein